MTGWRATAAQGWPEVVTGQAVNCLRTFAREFRYDTGRARYLMRDLDLATLQPSASYAGLWTDYAQDTAYGDYTLSPGAGGPAATTAARYQPGAWERAGDALRVHHGDQIGTSRFMTGASAQTLRRAVYTAFGELVLADDGHGQPPAVSRYDYAGAWGYETGLDDAGEPDLPPLPFVHVGERWYDPSTGRFLQRDPIGIAGGLNWYAYVLNQPLHAVDPRGHMWEWVAHSVLAVTDAISSVTGIDLDNPEAVHVASQGFAEAGVAAAGCVAGLVAPGATGLVIGFGGEIAQQSGIVTTGNKEIDGIVSAGSRGMGIGGLRPGPKPRPPKPPLWDALSKRK